MTNKRRRFFPIIGLILTFFLGSAHAQPYYYFSTFINSKGYGTIERLDLTTGTIAKFLSDTMDVSEFYVDPTQTWLYVYPRFGPALVINTFNPTIRGRLPAGEVVEQMFGIIYVPTRNRFYASWTPKLGTDIVKSAVFDASSFSLLDTIPSSRIIFDYSDVLSKDQSSLYSLKRDPINSYSYVETFLLSTNTTTFRKRLFEIGFPKEEKVFVDGKLGKVLFGYLYPGNETKDGQYLVYDAQRDVVFLPILDPQITNAYLSGDAKYVIIEETPVNPDRSPDTPSHLKTGVFYVFEAETGKLMQRLSLPPEGKVLVFDNYPDKVYYFNEHAFQSLPIDVTIITPDKVLLDTLVSLKHQAFSRGWLGDKNFVNELDNHLENAQKHLAKGDSVNSGKEVEKFQEKVNKEYQKTIEDKKKNKPRDKRFVTVEGWKFLFYNAQYILDRLPKKKGK